MDIDQLRTRFEIPGVLTFDEQNGMSRLHVNTPQASGLMYLQGAHIAHWQPSAQDPVLFLSRQSAFEPGKPIRGGIPIIFPWFGADSKDRFNGRPGPSHGYARLEEWTLQSAQRNARGLGLKLTLGPTGMSRSMQFDHFLLTLDVAIGETLSMALTVANPGNTPISFEEAFHNYFYVMDVHETAVSGLEGTSYMDKTDKMQQKPASDARITFNGPVDRVYLDTTAPLTIHDGTQRREIRIVKTHSRNTVVWNPGKALPDLGEWDWHEMVCVETANVATNAVTIGPGESFTMSQIISVQRR